VIHRVTFRTFVASTEDEEKVRKALSLFVPSESISSTSVVGHYGNEIKILASTLEKREGRAFLGALRQSLSSGEADRLHQEIPMRVDDRCQLFLRLDKQAAYEGRIRLSDQGDAIQVCAHLEAYPAKREKALKVAEEIL
jgi:RNA binding exosome subunit